GRARNPSFIWMSHRPAEFGERRNDRDRIATALGIDTDDVRGDLPIEAVSTGNPFLLVPLSSVDALNVASPVRPPWACFSRALQGCCRCTSLFAINHRRARCVRDCSRRIRTESPRTPRPAALPRPWALTYARTASSGPPRAHAFG